MKLGFDYGQTTRSVLSGFKATNGKKVNAKSVYSGYGLKFNVDMGPGALTLAYHMLDKNLETEAADLNEALSRTHTENTIMYHIPLGVKKDSGVRFTYITDTKKPDDSSIDATTISYLAANLYTKF